MTQEVLHRYIVGLAASTPLLVIFEDIHWVDPSSLDVLDRLVGDLRAVPILVVMTSRARAIPHLSSSPRTLSLGPLDERASRLIAAQVATSIALSAAAIDAVVRRSDGVPLYIEEMTRMAMDSKGLHDGRAHVPDTLMDLLMERLDRLGPGKWLAQVGSVIGREFGRRLLYSIAEMDRAAFDASLDSMLGANLLFAGDDSGERYVFKHALIEDAAYESIVPKTRTTLHARLADVLLRDFADAILRQPEVAARHLARAQRPLDASRYFLQAGGLSLSRGAPREAAAHLAEGVAVLSQAPPSRERSEAELALLSVLGPTTMVLRGPGSEAFRDVQRRA